MFWREPVRGRLPDRGVFSLSGLEIVRALMQGTIAVPPLGRLCSASITQIGPGAATLSFPASHWYRFPDATLDTSIPIESAILIAAWTGMAPGHETRMVTISTSHLRPWTMDGRNLVVRARTMRTGRAYVRLEASAEDSLGRMVQHTTATVSVRPMDAPPPVPELVAVEEPVYPTRDPSERPPSGPPFPYDEWQAGSGLEMMKRLADGSLPPLPIDVLLGLRTVSVEAGSCVGELTTSGWLCNLDGRVTAGAVDSLVSYTLGGVAYGVSETGERLGTLERSVTILRDVEPGEVLVATGTVHTSGGSAIVTRADVTDGAGNIVAVGQQTSVAIERRQRAQATERVLSTVLFTDIVANTEIATSKGDAAWREMIEEHNDLVRTEIRHAGGREVKTTGDGFLVTFDVPARGIECARAIRDAAATRGIAIRAGIHAGECEVFGSDIGGVAVTAASRICEVAMAGEVLVSSTVRDLVAGSAITFDERGATTLKGFDQEWRLYAVDG